VVALSLPDIAQTNVALFKALDAEIAGADICRRHVCVLADLKSETMDGKGVGECGRLEIHIHAPIEPRGRRAVDLPAAVPISVQSQFTPT
jgi:hypothetical protein